MLPQLQQIAQRVREMRDILDMTAEEVAAAIDVPVEVYESYEKAETDIPIGKLYLIADTMDLDPTVLLMGDQPRMTDFTVVRGGKGIEVERYPGYSFSSLAYNYIGRDMEPMIVTLAPEEQDPHLVTHKGQEFNYVLTGTVDVIIGKNILTLHAGDSVYFNPAIPHGQRAVGKEPARFLTIINE